MDALKVQEKANAAAEAASKRNKLNFKDFSTSDSEGLDWVATGSTDEVEVEAEKPPPRERPTLIPQPCTCNTNLNIGKLLTQLCVTCV